MAPSATSQKTSTRGSSRISLASVGKALADVINKDNSTSDKSSKKPREVKEDKEDAKGVKLHGRRSSAIPVDIDTARRRQSLTAKPGVKEASLRDATSPGVVIARASRRTSVQRDVFAVTEDGVIANKSATMSPGTARRASLRPRPANGGSALPKYRPRSMLVETTKKHPSPPRARRQPSSSDAESELTGEQEKELLKKHITPPRRGTRRRLSSEDEEHQEKKAELVPAENKMQRSISPLPKRALPTHTNIPVTVSPSTPVSKVKIPTRKDTSSPARDVSSARQPSPSRASPAPADKADRANKRSIPRPPSSTSSSSSAQHATRTPQTPPTPQTPTPARTMGKSSSSAKTGSPLRQAVFRGQESPLGKFAGKKTQLSPVQGSPSVDYMEGNSMDSAADVEFMLGTAVSPTAPTPAVPRLRAPHAILDGLPETPSRHGLPTRSDMSYLSPLPPGSGRSPRPPRPARPGADRGSILSWDQLAAIGDHSLGAGEARALLADVAAPFSEPSSPALSAIELSTGMGLGTPRTPESPALSGLPSPAGYGSISQVLLPDVTPSPAPVRLQYSHSHSPADAGTDALVTMLRLQLAAAERTAGERLAQVQALEAQLGHAADARMRDARELAGQVGALEDEMRGALEARERAAEEHVARVAALEEQVRTEQAARERVVRAAVERAVGDMARKQGAALAEEGRRWRVACAAKQATTRWEAVSETARGELELVAAGRDTLAVLLSGLEQLRRQLV